MENPNVPQDDVRVEAVYRKQGVQRDTIRLDITGVDSRKSLISDRFGLLLSGMLAVETVGCVDTIEPKHPINGPVVTASSEVINETPEGERLKIIIADSKKRQSELEDEKSDLNGKHNLDFYTSTSQEPPSKVGNFFANRPTDFENFLQAVRALKESDIDSYEHPNKKNPLSKKITDLIKLYNDYFTAGDIVETNRWLLTDKGNAKQVADLLTKIHEALDKRIKKYQQSIDDLERNGNPDDEISTDEEKAFRAELERRKAELQTAINNYNNHKKPIAQPKSQTPVAQK